MGFTAQIPLIVQYLGPKSLIWVPGPLGVGMLPSAHVERGGCSRTWPHRFRMLVPSSCCSSAKTMGPHGLHVPNRIAAWFWGLEALILAYVLARYQYAVERHPTRS